MRGEGERQKEQKVGDFREAMAWLIGQAENATLTPALQRAGRNEPRAALGDHHGPDGAHLLRVQIDDAIEADRVFTMLMGDEVEPRREFIETNALQAGNIDI
jgi:DNA gyrase subunit B